MQQTLPKNTDLVLKYRPLAAKLARKSYVDYEDLAYFDLLDLQQVALIGSFKAANKYDPKKASFGTYSRFWIKAELEQFVRENISTVKTPKGVKGVADEGLNQPSLQKDGESAENALQDTLISDPEDDPKSVVLCGMERAQLSFEQDAIARWMLREAEKALKPREAEVYRYRRIKGETLNAISSRLEVSLERVRQIEVKAQEKIDAALKALNQALEDGSLIIPWGEINKQFNNAYRTCGNARKKLTPQNGWRPVLTDIHKEILKTRWLLEPYKPGHSAALPGQSRKTHNRESLESLAQRLPLPSSRFTDPVDHVRQLEIEALRYVAGGWGAPAYDPADNATRRAGWGCAGRGLSSTVADEGALEARRMATRAAEAKKAAERLAARQRARAARLTWAT
ncbi:sigma-70 family RNA polymerase sigma factor [Acidocella aminolytica]|uniref:Uncharacterized protein n=1 Tax=Acidocella aminolytica 101 = DSM 11237 TaxID=1120923 RepID=A0A0D6PIG9_9PROT|nr:sigma-70 family RNA polymerase sigma factor [Acidocella aminolytica]GAN81462.1 hypothetical protein Aam_096_021 [Acidocella aminolytica 101 = DSM 11237]GBQ35049.1 hypothetical protein AA11237_0887 [Acidocella aminolytica 101 = DSM 11237]SHF02125.1 RNA polymerase sigma factor, sigma-70 family [Acidocella aminolytica 101 = DSM 11237]